MKADERRKEIVNLILSENGAVSGQRLAEQLGVSRQIIVSDISHIKAAGYDVISTHYGYMIKKTPLRERVFKTYHTSARTEEELDIIVGLGGTVVDVFVWHKVYGKMVAALNIFSSIQIKQFIEGVRTGKSVELMSVTGGYHYHTVRADNEQVLDSIGKALDDAGFIAEGE